MRSHDHIQNSFLNVQPLRSDVRGLPEFGGELPASVMAKEMLAPRGIGHSRSVSSDFESRRHTRVSVSTTSPMMCWSTKLSGTSALSGVPVIVKRVHSTLPPGVAKSLCPCTRRIENSTSPDLADLGIERGGFVPEPVWVAGIATPQRCRSWPLSWSPRRRERDFRASILPYPAPSPYFHDGSLHKDVNARPS